VTVAAGEASSAALCDSALAVAFGADSFSVLGTAFFGVSPATALSAVDGLISTTGGLEEPFSVAAADCALCASPEDAAVAAFVSPFGAGFGSVLMVVVWVAAAASCCTVGVLRAALPAVAVCCSIVRCAVGPGAAVDRRPTKNPAPTAMASKRPMMCHLDRSGFWPRHLNEGSRGSALRITAGSHRFGTFGVLDAPSPLKARRWYAFQLGHPPQ
jgi:hypothetical protein